MTVDKQGKYLIFNLDSGKSSTFLPGETYDFSVVNNKVVQARGPYNRLTTEEEEVIHLWEDRA